MLSTKLKGKIAELKVQLKALEKNILTSIPTTDERYDLILNNGKSIKRVQIKYCNNPKGKSRLHLPLRSGGGMTHYSKNEIDLLLVYCPEFNEILCFMPKKFHNKSSISINISNKQSKNYYKKYIW